MDTKTNLPIKLRSDVAVRLMQHMGSDQSIVAAARVSVQGIHSAATYNEDAEGHAKLIKFLMRSRHGSPFEHNSMTFLVEAPIFVFREFHRHRIGWSYNETSGRYKELEPIFWVPDQDRKLIQEGKPGAYVFVAGDPEQTDLAHLHMEDAYQQAWQSYQIMLEGGIAKEVARAVLPVATYSAMYATANARSIMHFLSLRTKREGSTFPSFPQREIEQVAEQIEEHFGKLFPHTYAAFQEYGRVAP